MSVISIAKSSYQLNGHKLTLACRWPCYGEWSTLVYPGSIRHLSRLALCTLRHELLFLEIVIWIQRVSITHVYILFVFTESRLAGTDNIIPQSGHWQEVFSPGIPIPPFGGSPRGPLNPTFFYPFLLTLLFYNPKFMP